VDVRERLARECHLAATELDRQAAALRAQRDYIVLTLRAEDPRKWTYDRLAVSVRCSRELIAVIVRTGRSRDMARSGPHLHRNQPEHPA
jgi:hypothetical protein